MNLSNFSIPNDREAVLSSIASLPDGSYEVTITRRRTTRSISSNRLYWLWLDEIRKYTGYEREELHEYFKRKFLSLSYKVVFDEVVEETQSTSELDAKEFTDYLEKIERYANTVIGMELPHPEDELRKSIYELHKSY